MAFVKFDPMFDSLCKKLGNYVHVRRGDYQIIRKYNGDRPPSTEKQVEVQDAFKTCISVWKHLPVTFKKSWKPLTAGTLANEYNLFIGANTMRQKNGEHYVITPGSDLQNLTGYVLSSVNAGEIQIGFDPVTGTLNLTVIVQKAEGGKGTDAVRINADAYSGTVPVVITGLESGAEYFVYCIVTDKPYAEMTKVSGSAGFKITAV